MERYILFISRKREENNKDCTKDTAFSEYSLPNSSKSAFENKKMEIITGIIINPLMIRVLAMIDEN